MPELPEVEIVVRQLAPFLVNRKVSRLEVLDPRLENPEKTTVRGRTILDVTRMGKQIVIHLSPDPESKLPLWLCFHLRMTGRLIMDGCQSDQQARHLRARLFLDNGVLNFLDVRRLGVLNIFHSLDSAPSKNYCPAPFSRSSPGSCARTAWRGSAISMLRKYSLPQGSIRERKPPV